MTLLALDLAANTNFKNPTVYSYGSPPHGRSVVYEHVQPGW